jgi:hypothetical protein
MIALTLIAAALAASPAYAQPRKLLCTSGNPFEAFGATLDDSQYDTGSGYFAITKPSYLDNYLSLSQMTCVGYDLKTLDCVGFAFGQGSRIEEVTLVERDGGWVAQLKALKGGEMGMHGGPWPCTVR